MRKPEWGGPGGPHHGGREPHARRRHRLVRYWPVYLALTAAGIAIAILLWSVAAGEHGVSMGEAVRTGGSSPPSESGGSSGDKELIEGSGHSTADPTASHDEDPGKPSGHEALVSNPLYETGRLAPRPCPVPNVNVGDPEAMGAFLNLIADCLDEMWRTQFDKADIPFDPPERVFWSGPGSSPCRDYPSGAGAFYCRSTKGIYIGTSDVVQKWNENPNSVVYASLLGHEYAHHVQGEAGLLKYYHEQRSEEETQAERNQWTRRSELQANCLAGAFLGAIRISYPLSGEDARELFADAEATADRSDDPAERTHGSPENSVMWTKRGWQLQAPGACNTWSAEPGKVA